MNLFKKKETISQNITFMAIMAAINVIFVLLSNFIPFLLFLLVFILPLCCTLVLLLCKTRYFIIYAVSSVALCLIVTIWNISDTLFYIVPSLITGFVFGLMIKGRIPYIYSLIVATFVQFGLSYLLVPFIELVTQINVLELFSSILNVNGKPEESYLIPIFVFAISFTQEIVSSIFVKYGLKHLNLSPSFIANDIILFLSLLINLLLTLLFVFVYPYLSFVFFITSLYFGYFVIEWLIRNKMVLNLILMVSIIVITLFLFAAVFNYLASPFQILFFEIILYFACGLAFINKCLINKTQK